MYMNVYISIFYMYEYSYNNYYYNINRSSRAQYYHSYHWKSNSWGTPHLVMSGHTNRFLARYSDVDVDRSYYEQVIEWTFYTEWYHAIGIRVYSIEGIRWRVLCLSCCFSHNFTGSDERYKFDEGSHCLL